MNTKAPVNKRFYHNLELLSVGKARSHGHQKAKCRCKCGKKITTWLHSLENGHTKSCGCILREVSKIRPNEPTSIYAISLIGGGIAWVSAQDAERVSQYHWKYNQRYGYAYAQPRGEKALYLHRFILELDDPKQLTDHRNGNKLDCTRSNLRVATPRLNRGNVAAKSKTGLKGVYETRLGRFKAQCCHQHIGIFDTPEEAARAYDARAKEIFGEFALLNFPMKKGA